MKIWTLALIALPLLAGAAAAQQNPPSTTTVPTTESAPAAQAPRPGTPAEPPAGAAPAPDVFAGLIAASNLFEIQAAEIAMARGQGDRAKAFAARLIADHREAQAKLERAAGTDGLTLAAATLTGDQQAKLQALRDAAEPDFDAAFLSMQVIAHQEVLDQMALFAAKGSAGALKSFAKAEYPTLHMHFVMAQSAAAP